MTGVVVCLIGLVGACSNGDDAGASAATPTVVGTTAPSASTESPSTPVVSAAPASTPAPTGIPVPATFPESTATTASVIPVATVPVGTTLRIADQYGLFAGIMGLSSADQGTPYDLKYVTLSPGPVQLAAFDAGEVDLGVVSPLGLIQASSGGIGLHAVARWRTDFALYGVVTAPGVSGVSTWADLRGKRVAFQRNTLGEALLLLNLDRAGMSMDDITVVDVPHNEVGLALEGGHADVGISSEPFISGYLGPNSTATLAFGIEEPMAQSTIIVARDEALADPARTAAIADYLQRLDTAFTTLTADRQQFTDLAVAIWKLDPAEVDRILATSHGVNMAAVPGDLIDPYSGLIELLTTRGLIDDLDPATLFDDRFASLFSE